MAKATGPLHSDVPVVPKRRACETISAPCRHSGIFIPRDDPHFGHSDSGGAG